MKKILIVFGTRPEAIKMAPLVKKLEVTPEFETRVCVTGQHKEMLSQVLSIFDIEPHHDLEIMKKNQDLYDITSNIMLGMREVLKKENPDLVLVHGDTSTSSVAALAAFYERIPVGHVEAGLRTNNIYSPWPEEMNRRITGQIATYHFAPTPMAFDNLRKENITEDNIVITGNTVIDALLTVTKRIDENEKLTQEINQSLAEKGYEITQREFVLITGHRRENLGEGFVNICKAISELAEKYPQFDFVYPVHLNPKVQEPVYKYLSDKSNVFLIAPIEYVQFVGLMSKSYLVLTDSGGIQEESPSLGKPVLVMRDTTERPEAIASGTAKLVGTNPEIIIENVSRLIEDKPYYNQIANLQNPYGDGKASEKIINFIKDKILVD